MVASKAPCPNSEINPEVTEGGPLLVGREYEFKIIKLSPHDKKIGLSLRAALHDSEREIIDSYRHSPATAGATIGETVSLKQAEQ